MNKPLKTLDEHNAEYWQYHNEYMIIDHKKME